MRNVRCWAELQVSCLLKIFLNSQSSSPSSKATPVACRFLQKRNKKHYIFTPTFKEYLWSCIKGPYFTTRVPLAITSHFSIYPLVTSHMGVFHPDAWWMALPSSWYSPDVSSYIWVDAEHSHLWCHYRVDFELACNLTPGDKLGAFKFINSGVNSTSGLTSWFPGWLWSPLPRASPPVPSGPPASGPVDQTLETQTERVLNNPPARAYTMCFL